MPLIPGPFKTPFGMDITLHDPSHFSAFIICTLLHHPLLHILPMTKKKNSNQINNQFILQDYQPLAMEKPDANSYQMCPHGDDELHPKNGNALGQQKEV